MSIRSFCTYHFFFLLSFQLFIFCGFNYFIVLKDRSGLKLKSIFFRYVPFLFTAHWRAQVVKKIRISRYLYLKHLIPIGAASGAYGSSQGASSTAGIGAVSSSSSSQLTASPSQQHMTASSSQQQLTASSSQQHLTASSSQQHLQQLSQQLSANSSSSFSGEGWLRNWILIEAHPIGKYESSR